MIVLYQLRPEGSDCTAPYRVELTCRYSVGAFINEVLKDKREWGYIGIDRGRGSSIYGHPECQYRYGELLYTLPDEFLGLKILKARASGGWSRMDYLLTVERGSENEI